MSSDLDKTRRGDGNSTRDQQAHIPAPLDFSKKLFDLGAFLADQERDKKKSGTGRGSFQSIFKPFFFRAVEHVTVIPTTPRVSSATPATTPGAASMISEEG